MKQNEIIKKLGLKLNPMQEDASEAILHSNRDVIVLSPTGSGKTYAYLPIDTNVGFYKQRCAGCRFSTRARAGQAIGKCSSRYKIRIKRAGTLWWQANYGRASGNAQRKTANLFATPGRLNDHLDKGNLVPESIKWLIIDEFDKCLEMGFQDEMQEIVGKLPAIERRILLSATESENHS